METTGEGPLKGQLQGGRVPAKGRFTVHVHVPSTNKTLTLVIPHPWAATILSLCQSAMTRVGRMKFVLPSSNAPPVARLGGVNGGLLSDDDLLEDIVLNPEIEAVWLVFPETAVEGSGVGGDRRSRSASQSSANGEMVINKKRCGLVEAGPATLPPPPLVLRIVTPEQAKLKNRIEDIPTLPSRFGVGWGTTILGVKKVIAEYAFSLGDSYGSHEHEHHHEVCNCILARKVARGGTTEQVHFLGMGQHSLLCALCKRELSGPCVDCVGIEGRGSVQCGYVRNVICQHMFHQHCGERVDPGDKCPVAHPLSAPKREYIPVDTTQRFLVLVWDRSKIEKVPLPPTVGVLSNRTSPSSSSASVPSAINGLSVTDLRTILRTVALSAHCDLADKVANVFGAQIASPPGGSEFRQMLFEYSCVISICSKRKHQLAQGSRPPDALIDLWDTNLPQPGSGLSIGSSRWSGTGVMYDIDIHTADAPIVCIDPQMQLGALHLDECMVGGVVNLFVTVRRQAEANDGNRENLEGSGMDAMFMDRNCWSLPSTQTERGMGTFLSSTRVFASRIAKADVPTQNAVLALFMRLTHFPPILRTLHTLMNGRSLPPPEAAVLVQCIYELTRELIAPARSLIENKQNRVLEASRLFYHLALELAGGLRVQNAAATEYLNAMKFVSLADAETFLPLADPVTTNIGIVEAAHFQALTHGMLKGLAPVPVIRTIPNAEEMKVLKLIRRTAGTMTGVTMFESDMLHLTLQSAERGLRNPVADAISGPVTAQEAAATYPRVLNYNIRELCQQSANGAFAVVPPMNLRSRVQEPALSLDGLGLMAVYVGRPACAPPDKDITIFRPTRGGAVDVDVSVITQQLEPILQQRKADGSISLDSLGEAEGKKHTTPSEIIMLCVDCSSSMGEPAGFEGLNDDELEEESSEESSEGDDSELDDANDDANDPGAYGEAQGILKAHECFPDILTTIRGKMFNFAKVAAAEQALASIIAMYTAELAEHKSVRRKREMHLTTSFLRTTTYLQGNVIVQRIDKLRRYVRYLSKVPQVHLVQFLLERASRPAEDSRVDFNEQEVHAPTTATNESARILQLPLEFQCPISYELFNIPVVAEDGFTYDKAQIERWFQTTRSSPMTGLAIGTVLLPNRNLATQIREWREGLDIIKVEIEEFKAARRARSQVAAAQLVKIKLLCETSQWEFLLPKRIRRDSLLALGFRCLRGETSAFTLMHKGELVEGEWTPSANTYIVSLKAGMGIVISKSPRVASAGATKPNVKERERVLVKVYNQNIVSRDHTPAFTFWILRNTRSTVASILFRYWTLTAGSKAGNAPHAFQVWASNTYGGDGRFFGNPKCPWETLANLLSRYTTDGTTAEKDPLYDKEGVDESMPSQVGQGVEAKKVKVLKLLLLRKNPTNSSKRKSIHAGRTLTRMDVVKQVFDNYINRTLAYDFTNHIGLITFATRPSIKQPISGAVEDLRNALNAIEYGGDTAMWDALNLASECIQTYSAQFPEAKKRILCLSDGVDTNSTTQNWLLCKRFQESSIVVDSISIGDENNQNLRALSYGTSGYRFFPQDLESAVAICELETVLSQGERPERTLISPLLSKMRAPVTEFRRYASIATTDVVNEDTYPARKQHPNLQGEFIAISAMLKKGMSTGNNNTGPMRLGEGRLMQEMRMVASSNQPYYDVYVSESNMRFWKVVMEAPADSTYAGGTYLLYLDMDNLYPRSAPKARFVTPILHPNINKHGRICHSILDRDWTSDMTIGTLLNVVWSLLLVPNKDDFANVVTTLNYLWDEVGYQEKVRAHVKKHATKIREQWRREILLVEID